MISMYRYKCSECKYLFSRSFEYNGKCPYCGKDSVRQDINKEELIKEIKEVDNFWVKKIR